MLETAPSLVDQIYAAVVDEIGAGRLAPGTHLVQERLAERFGVSRQPVQQAMTRLKADGVVEERGRRGLFVTAIDPLQMREHYGVRAALDGWAARMAARRVAADATLRASLAAHAGAILEAGRAAAAAGDIAAQVRHDDALHFLIYDASGNSKIAATAEPHWRYLRRAMADVLRRAQTPEAIWRQHTAILDAVLAGDADAAERCTLDHCEHAAERLAGVLEANEDQAS